MRLSSRFGLATASLLGLFAAGYLLFVYITGGPIACGLNGGCELVRASHWSHVAGIPLPLFGVLFYAGMMVLLLIRLTTDWQTRALFWLMRVGALLAFLESVSLFFIQWLDIKAFCTWCLVSAVAATSLFLFSLFDRVELTKEEKTKELSQIFVLIGLWMIFSLAGFAVLLR